ncbi:GDP-mannose 4,6-dehydratase [Dactylosporangium sp. CA-052675]|uniref:GDP-mannose 4,6-dehydratase n=1 Tax=Dactylosporangium sp. CA-052675 TaxID=3239927 RepID=UPI003D946D9B
MPRALITGITGQDGMYLAEFLTAKGYQVFGLLRGQQNPKAPAVQRAVPPIRLVDGDLRDLPSLIAALEIAQPDEVYNLAAISFVGMSWNQAELTSEITGMGVLRMLEAVRIHTQGDMSKVRFYQASSSEMFGKVHEVPQTETTTFHPRSPYGVAKTFGHYITVNYRESYGAYACSGILFNHESPRRGQEFVTRKVTRGAARIALGLQREVVLGNLDSRRDWGFAGDYVEAMWLMLQQDEPDDYVIATGETHSIRDLLDIAFNRVGIADWERHVRQDPRLFRPAEVDLLIGDATRARERLGWKPRGDFRSLIETMVDADLADSSREASASTRRTSDDGRHQRPDHDAGLRPRDAVPGPRHVDDD